MTFRIHAVKRAMLILLAAAFLSLPPFSVAAQAMHPIALIAGGATAGAAPNPAVAGQIVSLNPGFAPAGLTFASWAAVTPGVNILNPSSATGAIFVMSGRPVAVTANWEPIVSGDGSDENTAGGCNTGAFGALALILTAAIFLLGKWLKQA
jgi:hypothetical protein